MHRRCELRRCVLMTAAVMFLLGHAGHKRQGRHYHRPGADVRLSSGHWSRLLDPSRPVCQQVNIDAIVNQENGHLTFFDSNYAAAIANLDATKYGKAFAYISTTSATAVSRTWKRHPGLFSTYYGGKSFAGFFIDQMNIPS